jgi:hypothetical protein
MKFKFSWIIFLLVIFVPFEVIFLKYLPVSDTIYSYLRFLVELVIYLLAGLLIARYVFQRKIPKGTPVDKPILIFIAYAIMITIVNNAPYFQAFMGLRVLLRYVPLFYVIAFISIDQKFIARIFHSILVIATIQCLAAIYQHYFSISPFWLPRASDLEIGGKQVGFRLLATGFGSGREMGAGIGTFGDSVFLALFLVIAFTMAAASIQQSIKIPKQHKLIISGILILITISLFFTYSRGSVLVAIGGIPILIYLAGGGKKLAIYLTVGIFLLTPVIIYGIFEQSPSAASYINPKIKYTDPFSNITAVFSSSYLDNTMQFSRGAVLTEVGGYLVSSFKLLGYSPAQEFALEKAATQLFGSNMPINNLPIINDVYWVAFIIYYGLLGLAIYFFILYKMFNVARYVLNNSPNPYFRIFALTLAAIVIIAIPYSLILRTFVFRSFGFYFWLIAGLVFSEWRRLQAFPTIATEKI